MLKRYIAVMLTFVLIITGIGFNGTSSAASSYEITYEITDEGVITGISSGAIELNIPAEINGITVTAIDPDVFSKKLVGKLHIPATVGGELSFLKPLQSSTFFQELSIDSENPYFKMVDGVCYSKDGKTLYVYPPYLRAKEFQVPEGVETIDSYALYYCTSLENIYFPKSVKSIEKLNEQYFYGCRNLNQISVDSENSIYKSDNGCLLSKDGKTLMYYPHGKEDAAYTMPSGVEKIVKNAIYENPYIKTLNMNNSVVSIEEKGVWECSALESVNISNSLQYMGNYCFKECTALKSIDIPDGITEITEGSFENCSSLESISLPESLVCLKNCFWNCTALKSVEIPNGVKSMSQIFIKCKALESINLPKSLEVIEKNGVFFSGCSDLKQITIDSENSVYKSEDGCLLSKDGKTLMYYPVGKEDATYTIPSGVETIVKYAFDANPYLKTLNMSDSVVNIEERGILECSALESISFSRSLQYIGKFCFRDCTALKSIDIPEGITSIESSSFENCTSLENISLPKSLKNIGSNSFRNCSSLKSVEIPENVTCVSSGAFSDCSSLETISLGKSLDTFSSYLDNDTSLKQIIVDSENPQYKSVDGCLLSKNGYQFLLYPGGKEDSSYIVPAGVKYLGESSFGSDVQVLKKIVLPESMTTFVESAFCKGSSIETVEIPDSITEVVEDARARKDLIFRCSENSYARQYAIEHGYEYELTDCEKKLQHITGVSDVIMHLSDPSLDITPVIDGEGSLSYESDGSCITLTPTENGVTVTPVSAGIATITIKASETPEYVGTQTKIKVTVNKDIQKISCDEDIDKVYGEDDFEIKAEALGGADLSYSAYGDCVEVSPSGKVKLLKAGTAEVRIKAAATYRYQSAEKTIRIKVSKGTQKITCRDSFKMTYGNTSFYMGVKTYGNGEVSYSSSSDCVSVSSEGEVTINRPGEAEITVTMSSTPQYEACSKVIKIVIEGHEHAAGEAAKENVVKAGCVTGGSYDLVVRCKSCGEILTSERKTIDPLGHNEVADKAVASTYTAAGKTAGSHCSRCQKVFKAQKKVPMLKLGKAGKVSAKLKTYSKVNISWSKVKGATGYYVMYRKGSSGSWKTKKTSKLTYTTVSLKKGYSYQFKVKAYAKNGKGVIVNKGESSLIKSCRTLKKMNKPKAVKTDTKTVRVSWGKCTGATGYQVCVIPESTKKALKVSTSDRRKTLTPISRENSYLFKVRAYKKVNGRKVYAPWSESIRYIHK